MKHFNSKCHWTPCQSNCTCHAGAKHPRKTCRSTYQQLFHSSSSSCICSIQTFLFCTFHGYVLRKPIQSGLTQHLGPEKSPLILHLNLFVKVEVARASWLSTGTHTYAVVFIFDPSSFSDSIHPSHWGPEGGRSGTADDTSRKQFTTHPTASAPQSLFLYARPMTIDVLHVPNIRHMWLFQTPTTWCHLCAGHICSLLLWF